MSDTMQSRYQPFAPDAAGRATVPIFGRDPAMWLSLIEAVLLGLVAFQVGLDEEWVAAIMGALIAGMATLQAYLTSEPMLAAVLGLLKAGVVLFGLFGFSLDDAQIAALTTFVTVVVGAFTRTQASPQQGFERRP